MLNGVIDLLEQEPKLSSYDITPFLREQGTTLPAVVVQLSDLRPASNTQQFTGGTDRAEVRFIVINNSVSLAFQGAHDIRSFLQRQKDVTSGGREFYSFKFQRMDAGTVVELDVFTVSLDFEILLEQ